MHKGLKRGDLEEYTEEELGRWKFVGNLTPK